MKYECSSRVMGLPCAKCTLILGRNRPPEVALIRPLNKQGIVTF